MTRLAGFQDEEEKKQIDASNTSQTIKSHNDFLFVILLNKETILTLTHIHTYI